MTNDKRSDKRKTTVGYTVYVTPEEDKMIRKYGDHLIKHKLMEKNTKYGIIRYLLDQVVSAMSQSYVPGSPDFHRSQKPTESAMSQSYVPESPREPQNTDVTRKNDGENTVKQ